MKKFLSILLALISVICVSFAFGGCTDDTVVVRGQFYYLSQAYENGWLDGDDLESIAYCYYDSYNFEENPYSGKFTSTEELTAKMETELKQAYLEQIDEYPEGDRNYVYISFYFGTYNGNVAVRIHGYNCFDPIYEEEYYVGGVLFKHFWPGNIRVYHIN